ncbi:CheR family methyltransferase [Pedobacter namyangjuensis]|uniref:CheR family methyltransferase n=1 Tax=Pedobacter namyangjuensis TaxID=600626 RepID=UPI000DE54C9C|nr:CheR family methyltransferase [Pedobacter namyangjuensis]
MKKPTYIVAIGASAGGLEALSSFFEHTPLDGVAYVIIPHLSRDFKSRMAEILSKHSRLQVMEAQQGMLVLANNVYLIPNDKYMTISSGSLNLIDKDTHSLPHMTIDTFFTSLAIDQGDKAIGIVLSGVGSDGSRGAVAIENAGGAIMVQDPSTAKFDGMPRSAIEAVETKHIFSAQNLPAAIQRYVSSEDKRAFPAMTELELLGFTELIKSHYPFDFSNYKIGTLERRIRRRMAFHKITEIAEFLAFLQQHPEEMHPLISDFLISVTSFFRDPDAFQVMEERIIPEILSHKEKGDLLKIWVTCCASGEEAYSLAILVKEYILANKLEIEVKIFATDINENALKQASKGIYPETITSFVSPERIERFFDQVSGGYKIKTEIREMLIFARHDLTRNPPYCYVDLISCRNMLIYINPLLQRQIISKLAFGLNSRGFLFLGSSEHLSGVGDSFVEIDSKWKIYQSQSSHRKVNMDGQLAVPFVLPVPVPGERNDISLHMEKKSGAAVELAEVILSETGFSGVVIDKDGKVVHAFGDLGPYLKQERFKFDIRELLPEGISLAFSASFERVLESYKREKLDGIAYLSPQTGEPVLADMILSPFDDKKTGALSIIVFFKKNQVGSIPEKGVTFVMEAQTRNYIANIERKLMSSKTQIEELNESLFSTKEAMQSYNEELLSANEELQSANEELHSINEELETVNAAHKQTIAELSDLNDDLNNYFSSNVNGQLFVDRDILLKKFSPGAVSHINIRSSDIGRPLSNITTNVKFETIIKDIEKVLKDGKIVIKEIEGNTGRIYQVITGPYLKNESPDIHGAIITFYDVTELKRHQNDLDINAKLLDMALGASGIGTFSLNTKTGDLICSAEFKALMGMDCDAECSLELLSLHLEDGHRQSFMAEIQRAIDVAGKFQMEFAVLTERDGKPNMLRMLGSSYQQFGTSTVYLNGILQDMTVTENTK